MDRLVTEAYPHLRRLAESFLRRERPGHTLQATGLVNELYLVLLKQRKAEFENRNHFFSFTAFLMRAILRDWARERKALKRGGPNAVPVPLSPELAWVNVDGDDMLDLDTALGELEESNQRMVRLLELTAFLGCTTQEAADLTSISKATADRELRLGRAWLYRRLRSAPVTPPEQP